MEAVKNRLDLLQGEVEGLTLANIQAHRPRYATELAWLEISFAMTRASLDALSADLAAADVRESETLEMLERLEAVKGELDRREKSARAAAKEGASHEGDSEGERDRDRERRKERNISARRKQEPKDESQKIQEANVDSTNAISKLTANLKSGMIRVGDIITRDNKLVEQLQGMQTHSDADTLTALRQTKKYGQQQIAGYFTLAKQACLALILFLVALKLL